MRSNATLIRILPLRSVVAVAVSCALLFLSAQPSDAQEADAPVLYFADQTKPGQHVPIGDELVEMKADSAVDLQLELRLPPTIEQRNVVPLVIDDYRYDEPNHFQDKRVPNVVFELTSADGKPVAFGASSQGGGNDLTVMFVMVSLHIGIDPEAIDRDMKKLMADAWAKPRTGTNIQADRDESMKIAQKVLILHGMLGTSKPGTYRVRAHYRPKVAGKWIGEVSTKPITIKILDEK